MRMKLGIIAILFLVGINLCLVSAAVGVGLSPSKLNLQVVGGEVQEIELLVFNTGDRDMELNIIVEGDIADIATIDPESLVVSPEPMPHELPIKNGKTFKVYITPPVSSKTIVYSGTIAAVGSPNSGSQFGGSVGVATQVTLTVIPPSSFFDKITMTQKIIVGSILLLVLLIVVLKKMGLSISFGNKKK